MSKLTANQISALENADNAENAENAESPKSYAWAMEKARIAAGKSKVHENGTGRFHRLAMAFQGVYNGETTTVSFSELNAIYGGKRLTGQAGIASWSALLSKFNSEIGAAMDFTAKIERVSGGITLSPKSAD